MKRSFKFLINIVVVLILIRLALPIIMKETINWYLANRVEGYTGSIEDFDLALWRGNYSIEGFKINPRNKPVDSPDLLFVRDVEVSLAWRALFKGYLLMDLDVDGLALHFIDNQNKDKQQLEVDPDRSKQVFTTLIPFDIERLHITDSSIHFTNTTLKVPASVAMTHITAQAENIHNHIEDKKILPSTLQASANLQNSGTLNIYAKFNILQQPYALDIDYKIETFELNELNKILMAYGPLSFTKGRLEVYGETAIYKNQVHGYFKPFVSKVDVVASDEIFQSIKHFGIEMITAAGNIILRTPGDKTVATKVNFEGPMQKIDVSIWGAIWTAIKNAFTQELEPKIDNTVSIENTQK